MTCRWKDLAAKRILRLGGSASRGLCARRGKPYAESIARASDRFQSILNNVDFRMSHNGERRVARIASESGVDCVFDIGAHVGDYSAMIAGIAPSCVIHAFEILPENFAVLERNLASNRNIRLNAFGLSDADGELEIAVGDSRDTATAFPLYTEHPGAYSSARSVTCTVRKAADYVRSLSIDRIDLVKIDVEGMDLAVIRGFEDELARVRIIQFEYGLFNILSRDLLADFYSYLTSRGFRVGKIFPRIVSFASYDHTMENFLPSNYLAVRSGEGALIARLEQYG